MPLIHDVLAHKKKISAHELQKLFSQDRKEHLENRVIPALKKNITVISDRYAFSSFAYGKASGLELDWLVKLNKNFLKPDICFFLNTNPKTCMNRINMRGNKHDLFEKHKTLKKVYKNFLLLTKKFKYIKIINGEKSINQVFYEIQTNNWLRNPCSTCNSQQDVLFLQKSWV